MLFLADEDFPGIAVHWLRQAGHDVLWARTDLPGKADAVLLATAQAESRVILTCDKDFGELAFHAGLPASCGIVLLRFQWNSPELVLERVKSLMAAAAQVEFTGSFCVVEAARVRRRPLDTGRSGA
jgi:predicted nuclease of predicted toxin-antitoxin system